MIGDPEQTRALEGRLIQTFHYREGNGDSRLAQDLTAHK